MSGIMFLALPLNAVIGSKMIRYQKGILECRDRRVKFTNEIL